MPGFALMKPRPYFVNPFGVMIDFSSVPLANAALGLHIVQARPSTAYRTSTNFGGALQDAVTTAGLKLLMTARYNNAAGVPPDLSAYQDQLRVGLNARAVKPHCLFIENEENSAPFYGGTAADYDAQMAAAVVVAREYSGLKIANGGMSSGGVKAFCWYRLLLDVSKAAADAYVNAAFPAASAAEFLAADELSDLSAGSQTVVNKAQALMDVYVTSGMDYVNIHWYCEEGEGDAPGGFAQTIDLVQNYTGKKSTMNEWGLRGENEAKLVAMQAAIVKAKLPHAAYFTVEGAQAEILIDNDSPFTQTAMGVAWSNYLLNNKRLRPRR